MHSAPKTLEFLADLRAAGWRLRAIFIGLTLLLVFVTSSLIDTASVLLTIFALWTFRLCNMLSAYWLTLNDIYILFMKTPVFVLCARYPIFSSPKHGARRFPAFPLQTRSWLEAPRSGKPTSRDTGGTRDTGGFPLNAP